MDSSLDVSDPSDWLQTPLSQLGPVEQALRCQVCKDFFDTPMITSCSHTFCSLCIRRCLTTDGRCPACRTQDQAIKLRANSTVQELVDAFKSARSVVLQFCQNCEPAKESGGQTKKRKIYDTDRDGDGGENGGEDEEYMDDSLRRRKTMSRKGRRSRSDRADNEHGFQPEDSLTACPICGARMKEEAVYPHLDVHNESLSVTLSSRQSPSHLDVISRSRQPPNTMERLPQLNYSLLKDTALRKKLLELGIPSGGSKDLLMRRHTEWVNLVNANCDSLKPKTKRELVHELELWDKTQGRQSSNNCNGVGSTSTVMSKNFDGAAWASNHGNDYQALIAQARRKANPKVASTSSPKDNLNSVLDKGPDDG